VTAPKRSPSRSFLSDPGPLGRIAGGLLLGTFAACTPAPIDPPAPDQVVELTFRHTISGTESFRRAVTTLHRRGGASQVTTTVGLFPGGPRDVVTRVSSIDSASFQEAVDLFARSGAFQRLRRGPPDSHDHGAWKVTLTTEADTAVFSYVHPWPTDPTVEDALTREVAVQLARLRWHVPVE
jgi:hypothetical protein